MEFLFDNLDQILEGFGKTLWLLLFSGIIAGLLGTILVSMRVSPVALLRGVGTSYVNIVRNTPLLLILFLFRDAFPPLGFNYSINNYFNFFFIAATAGLGLYAAAFVCEALRSGINSIPVGQAEAARSLGMNFGQTMREVVLPQAFRAVIPPLASTYIALAKNTSVALAIGTTEATFVMQKLTDERASERLVIFLGFSVGYIIIVWSIALLARGVEKRAERSR